LTFHHSKAIAKQSRRENAPVQWKGESDWTEVGTGGWIEPRKGITKMKTALVLFFSLATLVFAEDNTAIQIKRVASVTWDPKAAKLIWVVQNGVEEKGEFVPSLRLS
jgi:hypothetical protein